MMRRFKRLIKKKAGAEHRKVQYKGGRRKKKDKFMWDNKEIEVVRSFEYLGYTLKENGKEEGQIKNLKQKANTVMNTIWVIGESLFRDRWGLRMRLFDALVKSVMEYGVELWGWKERKDLETIQRKYMKWRLKLDSIAPGYILHLETKRSKLETKTRKRAIKFEANLCKA